MPVSKKKPLPAPTKSMPAAPSTAVALKAKTSLKVVDDDFGNQASTGMENVTARDLMIPRIAILQKLSPQLSKNDPEFIKGAAVGDFCDIGTRELYKESLEIIPVFFARVFLEWAPRASGKGLVHHHGTDASILDKCTPDERNRMTLPSGNYIAETAQYFCLNVAGGNRRSFISLASTQLKASRRWMTLLTAEKLTRKDGTQFTPPIFYRSWIATPREQSNAEGDWMGWNFEAGRPIVEIDPSKELLAEAKNFYLQARDGLVTGDIGGGDEAMVGNAM